jgi:hypothetical protein
MPAPRARRALPSGRRVLPVLVTLAALAACEEGPRIEARPQVITFAPPPTPGVNETTATVTATASSGLPVGYASRTPSRCSVDAASGVVTATLSGTCTIAASQSGNAQWAAAPQATQDVAFDLRGVITFAPAPALAVHDLATVSAVESSGLPVAYATDTPATCSTEAATGLVTALAEGDCTVVARAGEARASQTIPVAAPILPAAPGAPTGVSASAGDERGTLLVRVGGVRAGGSPVTAWSVASVPTGLSTVATTLPATVRCPSSCAGYRVVVAAANATGAGAWSEPADVVTRYRVVATFREPDTQPNDTLFLGTFTYDASTDAVSGLAGRLSESMTGGPTPYPDDTMNWLSLGNPLSAVPATLGGEAGWLVTTFRLDTTDTLSADPRYGGTDGWSPGTGMGLHFGYPGANPGNAYARIFVRAGDPAGVATQAQLDGLAYADCAPGGMMGASCMTGTTVAGYGTVGTMGGYPLSQVTERIP